MNTHTDRNYSRAFQSSDDDEELSEALEMFYEAEDDRCDREQLKEENDEQ